MKKGFVNKFFWGFILCVAAFAFVVGAPVKSLADETIKIGLLEPMSGPFEFASRVFGAGAQFAADDQNEKGGLLGKKIEIIMEDSEMKPDVSIRKAKKLILEDKVNFLGVGSGSHICLALTNVAESYKVPLINYGAASDKITGKEFSRYAFRVCHTATSIGSAIAQMMAKTPYKKFYILCQDYEGGHDFADNVKKQLAKHFPAAQIVGEDYHPFATKDFAPYITKVIASKAEAVLTSNWGGDLTNMVNQARSLGIGTNVPFVMVFGNDVSHMYGLKDNAVGSYFAHMYELRVDTPENKEMIRKYHEKHKGDKDFLTWWPAGNIGQAICGWKMVFAAIEKAQSTDAEKFILAFEGLTYKSPVGLWSMRKCDHQVILPMFAGAIEAENPFFNGSIRPDVKFPWPGQKIMMFSGESTAIPATADYNPECK